MSTTIVSAKMGATIYLYTDGSANGEEKEKIDLFRVSCFLGSFVARLFLVF